MVGLDDHKGCFQPKCFYDYFDSFYWFYYCLYDPPLLILWAKPFPLNPAQRSALSAAAAPLRSRRAAGHRPPRGRCCGAAWRPRAHAAPRTRRCRSRPAGEAEPRAGRRRRPAGGCGGRGPPGWLRAPACARRWLNLAYG